MRELSETKQRKIINHLFSGCPYREIADIENVSVGAISNVFNEFLGKAAETSVIEAAEEYGVGDQVDILLSLAREKRELKVLLPDLLSGARLLSFMKARGLEANQLKDYLKMCDELGEGLSDFASKATEFYRLEKKVGNPYQKIVKEYSNLIDGCKNLRTEMKHAEDDFESELAANKLSREQLPYAANLKESLHKHGYAIEDTTKIPKFLREIEACGGNARIFLDRAEEAKDLKREIFDLTDEKKRSQPVVEGLREETIKLQNMRDQIQNVDLPDLNSRKQGLTTESNRLEKWVKTLKEEAEKRSNDLRLVDCLTGILNSKPSDVDALYNYVYWLKQIARGAAPEYVSNKPYYEEEVRKRIVDTLVEYLKEDIASRKEVTELQGKLQTANQQNSALLLQNEQLTKANEELSTKNQELENQVKELTDDNQKLADQIMREPTISPENTKLPF